MNKNGYIVEIVPDRRPFNCYMVLPLYLLQTLAPLLRDEIYSGKVGSDNQDRVILHLLLGEDRIAQVERILEENRIRA